MNILTNTILPVLVTAILSWALGRRKSKAEIKKLNAETERLELGNVEAVINLWKEMAHDLGLKVTELMVKCDELTDELELVRKENALLKMQLSRFEKKLEDYKTN
jgi:hypothetical protein